MKRLFIVIIIIALAASLYWRYQKNSQMSAQQKGIPSVVAEPLQQMIMIDQFEALGTLQANNNIEVTANTTEKVDEILFVDGQQVQKGAVLVRLHNAQQAAQWQVAKINLAEQEREFRRIEDLVRKRTVASSELDRLQSQIETAKAKVEEAEAKLNDRIIRAPFSGILGFRQVSQGALITPGTLITTLDDISSLKLDFQIPERFISSVQPGTEVSVRSDAYPDKTFTGLVTSLSSRVDPVTRALSVRARLDNPHKLLRPGMLMNVNVIRERREVLALPEQALVMLQQQQYVFVVTADNKSVKQTVTIGMRQHGMVEITSGLTAEQKVIIQGKLKVKDGGQVTLQTENWREAQP